MQQALSSIARVATVDRVRRTLFDNQISYISLTFWEGVLPCVVCLPRYGDEVVRSRRVGRGHTQRLLIVVHLHKPTKIRG